MTLSEEEANLRLMEDLQSYADWQFSFFDKFLSGDVLEIGGGTGTLTKKIAAGKNVKSCTVTEINPTNAESLNKNFGTSCRVVDLNIEKGIPDNFRERFDAVISLNVMEHVPDDGAFFRNCKKCLKKGGYMLLLVPAKRALYGTIDEAVNHHRRYEKADLASLASENKLRVVRLFFANLPGAVGWYYHGKILKARIHPKNDLRLFNMLVPIFRKIEGIIPPPFGLSLIMVARNDEL